MISFRRHRRVESRRCWRPRPKSGVACDEQVNWQPSENGPQQAAAQTSCCGLSSLLALSCPRLARRSGRRFRTNRFPRPPRNQPGALISAERARRVREIAVLELLVVFFARLDDTLLLRGHFWRRRTLASGGGHLRRLLLGFAAIMHLVVGVARQLCRMMLPIPDRLPRNATTTTTKTKAVCLSRAIEWRQRVEQSLAENGDKNGSGARARQKIGVRVESLRPFLYCTTTFRRRRRRELIGSPPTSTLARTEIGFCCLNNTHYINKRQLKRRNFCFSSLVSPDELAAAHKRHSWRTADRSSCCCCCWFVWPADR